MGQLTVDAIVVGAGNHGLVAAALLADAGWDVLVVDGRSVPGGAIASRLVDGFTVDEFSSCYPLGKSSPVLRSLRLEGHGLKWIDHRPSVTQVSGPTDGLGSSIQATPEATAEALEADHPGDGEAWLKLFSGWLRVKDPMLEALVHGWPPVRAGRRLARTLGLAGLLDFGRFVLLPSDTMGDQWFGGERARDLLAGNAAHADVSPLSSISGLLGFVMSMLAQDVGFPVPEGGAGALARALAARAGQGGAVVQLDSPVAGIVVAGGRASGVRLVDGAEIRARRAVVADVAAPSLYRGLLPEHAVPAGLRSRIDRFVWDPPTLKLNLLLDAPLPWRAAQARGATVVHAGLSAKELIGWHANIAAGKVPDRAFCLVGQMSTADPTRSPSGTESLWAYTHLPKVAAQEAAVAESLKSIETMFDDLAPGWRDLERNRWVQSPACLEDANPNLVDGAVGGGTTQLFQQGPWRPVAGLGGPVTHLPGLYLASSATHPGGAVHGGAGFNAARAALRDSRWWSRPIGSATTAAQLLLQRSEPEF